jgi:hypothetical protein
LLGLVLPLAAFAASPAMAASSTPLNHKTSHHAAHASHKVKPHHSTQVHHASHHATHQPSHKPTAS